ncbi:hypothetical protein C8J57DRAFT_1669560 [Mycena rebaudengoi]|nr:hypothetical protein C8J57DRAFT_1669560 [Mycena rebaudengoi]
MTFFHAGPNRYLYCASRTAVSRTPSDACLTRRAPNLLYRHSRQLTTRTVRLTNLHADHRRRAPMSIQPMIRLTTTHLNPPAHMYARRVTVLRVTSTCRQVRAVRPSLLPVGAARGRPSGIYSTYITYIHTCNKARDHLRSVLESTSRKQLPDPRLRSSQLSALRSQLTPFFARCRSILTRTNARSFLRGIRSSISSFLSSKPLSPLMPRGVELIYIMHLLNARSVLPVANNARVLRKTPYRSVVRSARPVIHIGNPPDFENPPLLKNLDPRATVRVATKRSALCIEGTGGPFHIRFGPSSFCALGPPPLVRPVPLPVHVHAYLTIQPRNPPWLKTRLES